MTSNVIFVLGAPGSGKTTACIRLAKALQLYHISAGQLLRNALQTNQPFAAEIAHHMHTGTIVPVSAFHVACLLNNIG